MYQLNPCPTSPTSHAAGCPEEMEPLKDYLRTHRYLTLLTSLKNKPQQNQPGRLSLQKYLFSQSDTVVQNIINYSNFQRTVDLETSVVINEVKS